MARRRKPENDLETGQTEIRESHAEESEGANPQGSRTGYHHVHAMVFSPHRIPPTTAIQSRDNSHDPQRKAIRGRLIDEIHQDLAAITGLSEPPSSTVTKTTMTQPSIRHHTVPQPAVSEDIDAPKEQESDNENTEDPTQVSVFSQIGPTTLSNLLELNPPR
ncbi:hypothetical protein BGX38DRAFT_1278516 [Terfezia claveryi]|nr:hypothetical protein BGX38DRAFT_1278516 [Terfezia claveryi]